MRQARPDGIVPLRAGAPEATPGKRLPRPQKRLRRIHGDIEDKRQPTFDFAHRTLPQTRLRYVPSGHRYGDDYAIPGADE